MKSALFKAILKFCTTKNTEFSFQLNESTLPGNKALLLGYVSLVYDGVLHEELEMALLLNTDPGERQYFRKLNMFRRNQIH